jgi:hypothetical protein
MNKYSKSPDPEKSLKDIKEEAKANASEYTDKVKERIRRSCQINLKKNMSKYNEFHNIANKDFTGCC